MIQTQTILKIADNSGAKKAKCIKVLGGFKKSKAKIGDIVVVSVSDLRNKFKEASKVRKKEVYKGLIVRTKRKVRYNSGESLQFNENAVVLINKQKGPFATRIIGAVPKNLKKKKFQKFLNITPLII